MVLFPTAPEIFRDYKLISILQHDSTSLIAIVEKDRVEYCFKGRYTQSTSIEYNTFQDEVQIFQHLSLYKITPDFIDTYILSYQGLEIGVMVMEKYDSTYKSTLEVGCSSDEIKNKYIDVLIDKMHEIGIIHADLHSGNIMMKTTSNGIKYAIIDFGSAFYINAVPKDRVEFICQTYVVAETLEEMKRLDKNNYTILF